MKGEWVYCPQYFCSLDCDRIVNEAIKLNYHGATIGLDDQKEAPSVRRTRIRWIDPALQPELAFTHYEFWKVVNKFNNEWFNFNITYLPPLQFTEYLEEEKAEYKTHQDIFWINSSPRHRKLTVILQLSDPSEYDGGDLILENVQEIPDPISLKTKGTVIVFPSFIYHRLTPVTRGKRHSLVGWFEGPKFQ